MSEIVSAFSNLKNKTGKHKDWYSQEYVKILCKELDPKEKHFSHQEFLKDFKKQYQKMELKDRLKLIASLLDEHLEMTYAKKLKLFESLLGPKWPNEDGMFTYGFFLYPFSQYVEMYGERDLSLSLAFIEKLTMRFTGEWAIRPLANMNMSKVLQQMKKWSNHENFHVRRLASEGLRARLPWGQKIEWVNESPEKTIAIYNKLRNDKVLYVRRSVANSMGDMIKIDKELACKTFEKWLSQKKTKENLWVIKHAIRTPVKKKDPYFVKLKEKVESLIKDI